MTTDRAVALAWLRKEFEDASVKLREKMDTPVDLENTAQEELMNLIRRRQTIGAALMLFDPSFDYRFFPH